MNCDVGEATKALENELWRRWSDRKVGEWAELIDIEIHSRAHSPTLLSLLLRHSSFPNPSVPLPTLQLILQVFCLFTYITAHSPTLPSLYLHHNLFSNPSVASPMSQLILQPFFRFSYVTGFHLLYVTWRAAYDLDQQVRITRRYSVELRGKEFSWYNEPSISSRTEKTEKITLF